MIGLALSLPLKIGRAPYSVSSYRLADKNEAACAADAAREVVERCLPDG
jgi:hypothetical protein